MGLEAGREGGGHGVRSGSGGHGVRSGKGGRRAWG